MAVEIDEAHRTGLRCSTPKCATSLLGRIARVRDRRARFTPGRGPCMAQGEKRENSVLFSLRELRQIEESRVQEEESAVRTAEEARMRAQQAEEQRVRNEEEARVRAERDHERSIEEARVAAER